MNVVDQLIKQQQDIEATRGDWEQHWQEIAERVFPRASVFNQIESRGTKRTERVFDSTPMLALERFAAVLESMLTPRTQMWHELTSTNDDLNKIKRVKEFFEELRRILFEQRYRTRSNFASQKHENYMQLGAFGTASIFIDAFSGGGIRYRSIHLGETFIAQNHQGLVDTYFRKFRMTAHEAMSNPKWKKTLPEKITKSVNGQQYFDFLHCVKPRADTDPYRRDGLGMPWASYYISLTDRTLLSEGGFRTFPYSIDRYVTNVDETYGRSPAMMVLADIKMINEMSKTDIRAVHKLVDPPLLLHNDGILGAGVSTVDMRPNALNYGAVNADGKQLIHPFQSNARVDIAESKMDQRRKSINDAFLVTLFQILVENPRMTATEALIRAQEKGALLTPAMGRQQSESLGPMIERELDVLNSQGLLPPAPPELIESRGEYRIIYTSPLSRLQRAEEVTGIQRTFEMLTPFAQVNPDVFEVFDFDEVARITADVNGVPSRALRSPEEVKRIMAERNRQRNADQFAQAAQPTAAAIKDIAQAQAIQNG